MRSVNKVESTTQYQHQRRLQPEAYHRTRQDDEYLQSTIKPYYHPHDKDAPVLCFAFIFNVLFIYILQRNRQDQRQPVDYSRGSQRYDYGATTTSTTTQIPW
jgi:hypothetical protein